ncbi:TadE/TadG family type IV pilus assembly protein [Paragemmobacter straminiformis]|uniref:Pilus assembly protein n=1 Tax=Paragemmobacter straminiformis TaxID=2045119 RepID=A0A842I9K1_9RHOB|nr:TadE/TadG family type IV pilus assembly protein [Gemmobacter straminiformis]MBC2835774.1 pilus assembly protein [Gemmobacter straminiformis]
MFAQLTRRLRTALGRYRQDSRGSVIILAAILFPVVIGGLGLWVETGYWYHIQRRVQHIADVSAHAAGVRIRAGDSKAQATAAARYIATQAGFPAAGTLTVNIPPLSGAKKGNPNAIEVILSENHARWFTALFETGDVALAGRAVTVIEGDATACMLALSGAANGAVSVGGSTNVTLTGCDIASNSVSNTSYSMGGMGSAITTGCIHTVGGASVNSGLTLTSCPSVITNAARARDPYSNLPEPAIIGACKPKNVGNNQNPTTLTPTDVHPLGGGLKSMRFCNGFDVRGEVTLMPGLYIVEGGNLTVNGGSLTSTTAAKLSGAGVTFYLASSEVDVRLNGNVTLGLSAPTTGPLSGVLFFGARTATTASHIINGSSGSVLQGAIYTPASAIQFSGDSAGTNGCTQVIASTITLTGNSTLKATCASAGTRDLWASEIVRLYE